MFFDDYLKTLESEIDKVEINVDEQHDFNLGFNIGYASALIHSRELFKNLSKKGLAEVENNTNEVNKNG